MLEINEELANAILNYLAGRPYLEVYQIIAELQKIQPIEKGEGDE